KWETARKMVPEPDIEYSRFNKIGIVSVGSCDGAIKEALVELKARGVGLNYCRVKAFPFSDAVHEFVAQHDRIYVIEQNRDAQFRSLLVMDTEQPPSKFVPMLHYNGLPISASFVVESVLDQIAAGETPRDAMPEQG
ncbi:MAG: 2-oxoacid:acceptor oxidoreductase subunit alpha, partial [Pseudomonadota bacterium]